MESLNSTVAHDGGAKSVPAEKAPALIRAATSLSSPVQDNKYIVVSTTAPTFCQHCPENMADLTHLTVVHDSSGESVQAKEDLATPIDIQDDLNSTATTPERWYTGCTHHSVITNFGHISVGYGELQFSPDTPNNVTSSVSASIHEYNGRSESPLLPYNPTPGFKPQVHRNEFVIKPVGLPDGVKAREYPPPPNIAYDLAAEALPPSPSPKERRTKSPAFAFSVGDTSINEDVSFHIDDDFKRRAPVAGDWSREEAYAKSIDFDKKPCEVPGSSDFYPAEEQREDFIKGMEGKNLEWCRICKTNHIPPGSPITLADRDPCGAYLPDWFPTSRLVRPWDRFTAMLNEYVKLDEILQGYGHDHYARPQWDKVYHEPSPGWRALGRRGGWWKCRGDKDAPSMERKCYLCHGKVLGGETRLNGNTQEQFLEIVKQEKQDIENFCSEFSRLVGYKDREIVEARWRRDGVNL